MITVKSGDHYMDPFNVPFNGGCVRDVLSNRITRVLLGYNDAHRIVARLNGKDVDLDAEVAAGDELTVRFAYPGENGVTVETPTRVGQIKHIIKVVLNTDEVSDIDAQFLLRLVGGEGQPLTSAHQSLLLDVARRLLVELPATRWRLDVISRHAQFITPAARQPCIPIEDAEWLLNKKITTSNT